MGYFGAPQHNCGLQLIYCECYDKRVSVPEISAAEGCVQKLCVFYLNYLEIFVRENPYPYVVHRRVTL